MHHADPEGDRGGGLSDFANANDVGAGPLYILRFQEREAKLSSLSAWLSTTLVQDQRARQASVVKLAVLCRLALSYYLPSIVLIV